MFTNFRDTLASIALFSCYLAIFVTDLASPYEVNDQNVIKSCIFLYKLIKLMNMYRYFRIKAIVFYPIKCILFVFS